MEWTNCEKWQQMNVGHSPSVFTCVGYSFYVVNLCETIIYHFTCTKICKKLHYTYYIYVYICASSLSRIEEKRIPKIPEKLLLHSHL